MNIDDIDKLILKHKDEYEKALTDKVEAGTLNFIKNNIEQLEILKGKIGIDIQPKSQVENVLKQLGDLDLTSFPYEKIVPLIKQLGQVPTMVKFLYPTNEYQYADSLMRARPYRIGEDTFRIPADLSFKPQQFNTTYQRASTPYNTMFYGCLKKIDGVELQPDNRLVSSMEALRMLSQKETEGKIKRVAFGKWIVTEQIRLAVILGENQKHAKNPAIQKMYLAFRKWVKDLDIEEDAVAISNFFADRFADEKAGEGNEHLYMLSAMWTEACVKDDRIDGVLYPSVRSEHEGICVALTPKACSKIKLVVAADSLVYKHKSHGIIDNDLATKVDDGATSFIMRPVEPKYIMGEREVLKRLGLKSIDEMSWD